MNVSHPAKRIFSDNIEAESADVHLERSKQDDAYIQTLLEKARPIWKKRKAICDSEGFYQHQGECWNDAIQQVMNNTDGIKEWVQGMFMHEIVPLEAYKNLPDTIFGQYYPLTLLPEKEKLNIRTSEKKWAILYLREAQKRFLRHYITEATRRTYREETCSLEQPAHIARKALQEISMRAEARKQGAEGERAALYGSIDKYEVGNPEKIRYRASRESYQTHEKLRGGKRGDIRIVLSLYQSYIAMSFEKATIFQFEGRQFYLGETLILPENTRAVLLSLLLGNDEGGHQMAFYQCGNSLFLYDDNFGILPFNWKLFLSKAIETNSEIYFATVLFLDKTTNTKFGTAFYPILCYQTKDSLQKSVILYENSFMEIDPNWNSKVEFEVELDSVIMNVAFNKQKAWRLRAAEFITVNGGQDTISNTKFVLERNARLSKKSIKSMSRDELLSFIQTAPLEKLEGAVRIEEGISSNLLYFCLQENNLEAFQALLERGVNPNIYVGEDSLLVKSIQKEDNHFFYALLAAKANPSMPGKTKKVQAIHLSIHYNHLDMLAALIKAGADVNAKTIGGLTPLNVAVNKNSLEAFSLLCQYGADPTMMSPTEIPDQFQEVLAKCGPKRVSGGRLSKRSRKTKRRQPRKKTRRGNRII